MTFDANKIQALTFDCYGTLIDWDGGIRAAVATLPSCRGADLERLIEDREREEYALLKGGFRLYGDILAESIVRAASLQGCAVGCSEAIRFARSMGQWPAFPDSGDALERLAKRFRLAILSNVETGILERSVRHLKPVFEHCVTAEQVRSYKPATAHFTEALQRLDLPPERVLHVCGSVYHDVRPAQSLGWRVTWVNRRDDPAPEEPAPDQTVNGLEELADLLDA